MAKTTTFSGTDDGNLDNELNWNNGLPVAGDTARIAGDADSGSIGGGITINYIIGILSGTCEFYSFVNSAISGGSGQIALGVSYGPSFLGGFSINGRKYLPETQALRFPRRTR